MSNKIRVRSGTEYVIEVNDNGDTISFDTADTSLTSRFVDTFQRLDSLTKEYEQKAAEIDARPDEPYSTFQSEDGAEIKTIITKNQYDAAKLIDQYYGDARAVLDVFLGQGACQKIFGSKNYYSMFSDLSEQLQPHFEKMGINAEALKKRAVEKHAPNRQARRAVK